MIHDEIADVIAGWMRTLENLVAESVALGHLHACDAEQVAFEIEALLVAGNHMRHLADERWPWPAPASLAASTSCGPPPLPR